MGGDFFNKTQLGGFQKNKEKRPRTKSEILLTSSHRCENVFNELRTSFSVFFLIFFLKGTQLSFMGTPPPPVKLTVFLVPGETDLVNKCGNCNYQNKRLSFD